jgi:predicted metal-dependent peptidase
MSKNISNDEFLEIARDLEVYHAVFSKIWNIGKPVFVDEIPTAAVSFDKEGNHIDFKFNPTFWDSLTKYERNFIICHECLHIILTHGVRLKDLNPDLGNIAADVAINEMLVEGFGFDRTKLPWVDKNGCWINTVFNKFDPVPDSDKAMEYYYNLLKKDIKNQMEQQSSGENSSGDGSSVNKPQVLDDHEGLKTISSTDLEDILNDVLDELHDEEKQSLKDFLQANGDELKESVKIAGSMPGNIEVVLKLGKIKPKRKWETVIKKWANKFIKQTDKNHEQWARVNRRFVGITSMMGNNMFLPSEMEIEELDDEKRRIKVVFFQDTSGSCSHLAERFFKAAKSLPKDRFEIELYCFDTQCYSTTLESGKLYGFGGTSFSILETKVMELCKNDLRNYPRAVFVITDGYGDYIHPKKPKNWYWFLSENCRTYIPTECNIFKLSEFE